MLKGRDSSAPRPARFILLQKNDNLENGLGSQRERATGLLMGMQAFISTQLRMLIIRFLTPFEGSLFQTRKWTYLPFFIELDEGGQYGEMILKSFHTNCFTFFQKISAHQSCFQFIKNSMLFIDKVRRGYYGRERQPLNLIFLYTLNLT